METIDLTTTWETINRLKALTEKLCLVHDRITIDHAVIEIETAIAEAVNLRAEIERLRKERDKARREVCEMTPRYEGRFYEEARGIAVERGWDCFMDTLL